MIKPIAPTSLIAALFALLAITQPLSAQTTQLRENVNQWKKSIEHENKFGPNGKYFFSGVYGIALIAGRPASDSLQLKSDELSNQLFIGYRGKLKLTEYVALGGDLLYFRQAFKLLQSETHNVLSPGKSNAMQRLTLHDLTAGIHLRLNFGKRGDYLGKYIDLGGEMHTVFWHRLLTKNYTDPTQNNGGKIEKVIQSQLNYIRTFQEFAVVRIGWSAISISARYRLNGMFRPSNAIHGGVALPELPRFSIALEFLSL